ncbi:HlyC/CorC family transporter [candidate division KSB1 bacterium]|nr:HlyC/CorC family transporter [candidate division KSB1 bacterium]RQW03152.1 MAG: HlyC/CorC family transporter [candidate division KSB1 bacterium]
MPPAELILFILSLLLSAFFSGSETAYISANRLKIRLLYRDSDKASSTATLLRSDQRFLSTTLVGNNIVMVACSSLAIVVFSALVSDALVVVVTTVFLLLFGEIIPKSIASQMPNRLLRFSVNILPVFYFFFYPLIWFAEQLSRLFIGMMGLKAESPRIFSRFDLLVLVREYTSGKDVEFNQKLLSRALKLRDKRLWDVMVPRIDILGVEKDDDIDQIKKLFKDSGYSRLPVYQGDLDNILGFLYVMDFFGDNATVLPEIRKPLILSEGTKVIEALNTLQRERTSIAVTVDEHGGTAGLVTMEDMIEKLVGAIYDEFDLQKKRIKASGESTLVVDGKTSIDDLRERYDFDIPEGDYVTIAGFITDRLGAIPESGQAIDFDTFKLKVLDASETKIVKVWLTKKPPFQIKHNTDTLQRRKQ